MALSPAPDRYFDPVQLVQIGSASGGLEGAVASATGAVLLWGWLHDPDKAVHKLSCVVGGEILPVELLDRIARPDVVELHAATVRSSDDQLGFLALAHADGQVLQRAGGRIALQFDSGEGAGSSINRLFFEPGSSFRDAVLKRLPLPLMQPQAIRRAVEILLWPENARVLREARRSRQVRTYGAGATPQLALVIPVTGDGAGLRETLSYLDMSLGRSLLEVVLVLASDRHERAVDRAVREAEAAYPLKVVRTAENLGVGGAARLGLDACTADQVILMSELIVPPAGLRPEQMVLDLGAAPFAAPRALPRFDGLPHRFEPRALVPSTTAWPHDGLVSTLRAAAASQDLDSWSPGLVGARLDALLDLQFDWSAPLSGAGFWAALLAEVVRSGAVELAGGSDFTFAPISAPAADASDEDRLLDGYGLEALLLRRSFPPQLSSDQSAA